MRLRCSSIFALSCFVGCVSIQSGTEKTGAISPPPKVIKPAWVLQSDRIAEEYSRAMAELVPEIGSGLGFREYDKRATVYSVDLDDRFQALRMEWKKKLSALIAITTDEEMLTDLRILADKLDLGIAEHIASNEVGRIPFFEASKTLYYSIFGLLDEQNTADRKSAAVDRFHSYVRGGGGPRGARAMTVAMRDITEQKLKEYSKKKTLLPPSRAEIKDYLEKSPKITAGLQALLLRSGRPASDWQDDLSAFEIQIKTYDDWLRTSVLPLARKDFRMPAKLYELALQGSGLTDPSEAVALTARDEFKKNLVLYRQIAAAIATREKLTDHSPKAVLQHFKRNLEFNPEKIRARYEQANRELSAEIVRRDLVSLPQQPLRIRLADEAESAAAPVPHLNTPSFVGNTGERPEFVVPVGSKEKLAFDDFAYQESAKALTAHEGRPGHDLQFSAIIDRGNSIIRANYAFNSVNVEGWALYAEWLMEPSMSEDEKMGLMASRMMRNARMFLDPELQKGKITPAEARRVITEDVGMSGAWADLELRRYMWDSPGQAPSYYYGYLKLRKIREQTQQRLGESFTERCLHDAILETGLVPLGILAERMQKLTCSKR